MITSRTVFLLFWAILTGCAPSPPSPSTSASPPRSFPWALVTDHPQATSRTASLLGNEPRATAADAVIAAALAMGVASPQASGPGGGGFALCWDSERPPYGLDFRETAPAAASPSPYLLPPGVPGALSTSRGGGAVATPGEPMGLAVLNEKRGAIPLISLVKPAVALAKGGIVLTPFQAGTLPRVAGMKDTLGFLGLSLWPGGLPLQAGSSYRRPDLAASLERYGREGPSALMLGSLAEALVNRVAGDGGVLSLADVAGYLPVEREPLRMQWGEYTVLGFPPPGGAVVVMEALSIYQATPLPHPAPGSGEWYHRVAESLNHAFADRNAWLGDPEATVVPVAAMLDRESLSVLASRIQSNHPGSPDSMGVRSLPHSPPVPGLSGGPGGGGTSNVVAVDSQGGACVLTSTINLPYGSGLLVPESGIVLNNEMDDFSLQRGQVPASAPLALSPSAANALRPGRRPASSMSPILVLRGGRPILAVGASGGPTIISSVLQVLLRTLKGGQNLTSAISAPRVHTQWRPQELRVEVGISKEIEEDLARRGHTLVPYPFPSSVTAIDLRGASPVAVADSRKGGSGIAAGRDAVPSSPPPPGAPHP